MSKTDKLMQIIKYDGDIEVIRLSHAQYRVGYCSQCGMCCKTISMATKGTQTAIDWLRLHNVEVRVRGVFEKVREQSESIEHSLSITFDSPCRELQLCSTMNSTNQYHCNIYENRPSICKEYPRNPSSHKTCTYVFLSADELSIFTKEYSEYWRDVHGQKKEIRITFG